MISYEDQHFRQTAVDDFIRKSEFLADCNKRFHMNISTSGRLQPTISNICSDFVKSSHGLIECDDNHKLGRPRVLWSTVYHLQ